MKYQYFSFIIALFFVGCLEDKGTYEYEELEKPIWKSNYIEQEVRSGDVVKFRSTPYFAWAKDSARRASEVRYVWKYGDVVLSEDAGFDMSADMVFQKIGLTKFDGEAKYGSFSIIEKEGGEVYTHPVLFKFLTMYASADWFVVSEKNGYTQLSVATLKREGDKYKIAFKENVYKDVNGSDMLGKPISISSADGARNIGSLGTVTVLTDQKAYEINCENIQNVGNLDDAPVSGRVVLRKDNFDGSLINKWGMHTYVVGEDGQIYRRIMSKNNLSGNFESEPLALDSKGYKVTHFGQCLKEFDSKGIPCWDEKNRRVFFIYFDTKYDDDYKMYLLSKLVGVNPAEGMDIKGCAPIWNMPEGVKPLYLWNIFDEPYPSFYKVGMLYNDASGKTRLTIATTDIYTRDVVASQDNVDIEFPGGQLDESSRILTSSAPDEYYYAKTGFLFYSKGNQIRYVNIGSDYSDNPYIVLDDTNDRIAFMKWVVDYYRFLFVATEKGKILVYQDKTRMSSGQSNFLPSNPTLLCELATDNKFVDGVEIIVDPNTYYHKDRY